MMGIVVFQDRLQKRSNVGKLGTSQETQGRRGINGFSYDLCGMT